MGTGCCTKGNEVYTMETQLFTESITATAGHPENMKLVNEIKVMDVHKSMPNNRIRQPFTSRGTCTTIQENLDRIDRLGLLSPVGIAAPSAICQLPSLLRCPTNFKVEPLHFRLEHDKTSLEGKYIIEGAIGKGSFGEVKKIKDKETGEFRAMKVISKSNCQKTHNFADEIEIIKKLDHPNIVRFYEFYQDKDFYYLVTEFCEGGDLLTKIGTFQRLAESKAAKIMLQILSAMDTCHKKHIAHRDLKPENVLFEGSSLDSTVKVIDFGRSKLLMPKQKIIERAGSLFYMAPEVLQCKEYNEQCDIWSAGVILYLLLAGIPPFYSKNREETIQKIIKGTVDFSEAAWSQISEEAKTFIKRLLKYASEERPTAWEAMQDPWLQKYGKPKEELEELLRKTMENLLSFRTQMTLQKAVLAYIASQELSKPEEQKLKEAFEAIDRDNVGAITKDEMMSACLLVYRDHSTAKLAADRIMVRIDINQNGKIDYNEFLMANLDVKEVLTDERLKKAFNYFDINQDGAITKDELAHYFAGLCDNSIIDKLLSEVDNDRDGKISHDEFMKMMHTYIDAHMLNVKKYCLFKKAFSTETQ